MSVSLTSEDLSNDGRLLSWCCFRRWCCFRSPRWCCFSSIPVVGVVTVFCVIISAIHKKKKNSYQFPGMFSVTLRHLLHSHCPWFLRAVNIGVPFFYIEMQYRVPMCHPTASLILMPVVLQYLFTLEARMPTRL